MIAFKLIKAVMTHGQILSQHVLGLFLLCSEQTKFICWQKLKPTKLYLLFLLFCCKERRLNS